MQRSQNASVLQRTQRDAVTANRTVDAPQGADGGVHCRLAAKMSCKARQGFARCFVGDDACIVPQTLRCRKAPRRAKSPALHCGRKRALTCKRQPFVRPAGGPMQASVPTQGGVAGQRGKLPDAGTPPAVPRSRRPFALHCRAGRSRPPGRFAVTRKDIGKARHRPPQSANADSSPYRGAFQAAVPQSLPCKGLRSRAPPAAEKAVSHAGKRPSLLLLSPVRR